MRSDPLPHRPDQIRLDSDGAFRVGSTRVTLGTVVGAFLHGCTAEEVTIKYPSLELADVYGVIAYYLRNREAIDAYLAECAEEQEDVRREAETRTPHAGIRERLVARGRLAS